MPRKTVIRTSPGPKAPAQPNLSLIHGLETLEMLVSMQRPLGSRELGRLVSQEHTRVNRLLGTLAHLGLAERTPDRKYIPGPAVHVLAAMSLRGSRLLATALRRLPPLMEEQKDLTIALGVLWRSYVCYIFFGAPGRPLEEAIGNTAPFEAERSGIGRILLSHLPPAAVDDLYRRRAVNPLPPAARKELLCDLAGVRRKGYALVANTTVGVAVGSPPLAGLAAAGRLDTRRLPALVRRLQETAAQIAQDLAQDLARPPAPPTGASLVAHEQAGPDSISQTA